MSGGDAPFGDNGASCPGHERIDGLCLAHGDDLSGAETHGLGDVRSYPEKRASGGDFLTVH